MCCHASMLAGLPGDLTVPKEEGVVGFMEFQTGGFVSRPRRDTVRRGGKKSEAQK